MNLKRFQLCLVLAVVAVSTATVQAQPLFIDFDNGGNQDGGPHTQAGYQSYIANHEVAAEFTTQNFNAFGTSIAVTPAWPNSTANTVMQMIDRAPGNDENWSGE